MLRKWPDLHLSQGGAVRYQRTLNLKVLLRRRGRQGGGPDTSRAIGNVWRFAQKVEIQDV